MTDTAFKSENEPYGSLQAIYQLDEALQSARRTVRTLAVLTQREDLTPVESAVIGLIPTSISIAASVRELIRQAYIPAAKILLRPLWERTAVVDYIVNEPDGLRKWLAGKRPPLRGLLRRLGNPTEADHEIIRLIVADFHSVVHADPDACQKFLSKDNFGNDVYSAERSLGVDEAVEEISASAFAALTFLESNAKRAFRVSVIAWGRENPKNEENWKSN